jgi:hypothetical protein
MKTQLFLVCCAALALGSGCATYDSGGTADDTVVVSGSGDRDYYYEPYNYVDPHRDYFGRHIMPVWKQPNPNGTDWTDPRPEFLWYR